MKIGIIPDIHTKIDRAESIIHYLYGNLGVHGIVFLGDYVDDFNDDVRTMVRTLLKVGEWQSNYNNIMLLGNHEANYMHPKMKCVGWTKEKQEMWDLFNGLDFKVTGLGTHYMVYPETHGEKGPSVLFTHAGLPAGLNVNKQTADLYRFITEGVYKDSLDYHVYDGGEHATGSIITARNKRTPYEKKYRQIFGHTPSDKPQITFGDNGKWLHVGLDTNLNHFGVMMTDSQDLTIYEVDKFKLYMNLAG